MKPASQSAPGPLLAEFPTASQDDWRQLVEKELKGAPFETKMFTRTAEGITLRPLYTRADAANLPHSRSLPGFAPFVRGSSASGYVAKSWEVSQEIACADSAAFNLAARQSIDRGLHALNIVLDRATRNGFDPDWAREENVGLGGLSIASCDDLDRALEGIRLDETSLFIRSGASALPFAALLFALARRRGFGPEELRGCIEMDPIGVLAHEGKLPQSLDGAWLEMATLTEWARQHAPQLKTICIHSRAWHEGGANAVQELAFTVATGVEYLRRLDALGLPVNDTAPRMRFAITVGANFFLEIAKIRALRMLWARVVSAAGGDAEAQKASIHIRTSLWNKTKVDPYNNLLRSTVEAFAGVLGGCDSMQVGAFDEVLREPDDFSRRIARNTQLVLQRECDLNHVVDPVGGSWYVETLTAELANLAWSAFQDIEKSGGIVAAMQVGIPQKATADSAVAKVREVTSRRASIVGVSIYADPSQKPLEVPSSDASAFQSRRAREIAAHRTSLDDSQNAILLDLLAKILSVQGPARLDACIEAVLAGATLGEITRALRAGDSPCAKVVPVCTTRVAAPLEALRAAMDRHPGGPATVFLCNMGPLKEHKARADFSCGFFAVGGYEAVSPAGFATPEDAVAAFLASGSEVAVICSTDDHYTALVPPIAAGIRTKKPNATLILAGYPQDQIETHRKFGVDEFIHLCADLLEVLSKLHAKLGIS